MGVRSEDDVLDPRPRVGPHSLVFRVPVLAYDPFNQKGTLVLPRLLLTLAQGLRRRVA